MNVVREIQHAGKTVRVVNDEDPMNPRKEYDNITIIAHWHPRYLLGDKKLRHCTKEELIAEYADNGDPILAIRPLHLYDHSGLSISVESFSCSFDSGQVGYVFITQSKSDLMGCEGWTTQQYDEAIKGDVETYNSFLTGEVYAYDVVGRDGEMLEAVGGFYDIEDCLSEGKSAAEGCEDPWVQREAEELASRVTYASVV